MSQKKSYNPLKMWGSYLGAVIAILMPSIIKVSLNVTNIYLIHLLLILSIVSSGLVGFLIGWGIHSLFRALRNKK